MRSFAVALLAACAAVAQTPDCSLAPGWAQQGAVRSYQGDTLFEYMNGNAEGYVIYGYSNMKGVSCAKGGETILIDVHEMVNPEAAWGIYAANRSPDLPGEPLGMAGQVGPRKATFAKDKYYVDIAAEAEKDNTSVLRAMAQAMDKRIAGRAKPPDELGWFQGEPKSLRLIPESVLGIRLLKRGYVAQYERAKAFLVREDSPEAAAATLGKLRSRFGNTEPAQIGDEALKAKDRYIGNVAVFRKGSYVGGYSNVPDGEDTVALAMALAARVP